MIFLLFSYFKKYNSRPLNMNKMVKNSKIIIIGAGAAGIASAVRLYENGFKDFTILEAENRIGGRIHSVNFEGHTVDLGAQWCHGEENNVVYELVKGLNLIEPSVHDYFDNIYYDSSGIALNKNIADELAITAYNIYDDQEALKEKEEPFGDYFIRVFNQKVKELSKGNREYLDLAPKILDWFHKLALCLEASPNWFDFSTSGHLQYRECEGSHLLHWKDTGFKAIFDVLLKKLPDHCELPIKDKIIFNKKVTQLLWDASDVTVTCADGTTYVANIVILTVSLGVLKNNYKTLFVPDLPLYKQSAIEGMSIGTVVKIFLKFPTKWWPDDCNGFSLVWSENDRCNIPNEFPYGPVKNGNSWLADVVGFYLIDNHPEVLLAWIVGECASEVELLPEDVLVNGFMYLLHKFVSNKYNVQRPQSIIRTKWHNNPNFKGCYSYRSLETEKRRTGPQYLAQPLFGSSNRETVLFAGEATHAWYYSTVHGAIESGFREANRIIDMHKTEDRIYTVAIVGAGMAGLAAAKTLTEGGCTDIIILEAQDRPGGRIHTIKTNDGILELGAQWIHGEDNPLYELAKKYDLLSMETSEEGLGIYVRDDGVVLDEWLVKQVDFKVGEILEECEKFSNETEFPNSLGEFLESKFLDYLATCDDPTEKEIKLQLYDWHVRFQIIDNSCEDLKKLSAKAWGNYDTQNMGQAHVNLKFGYQSLIDVILNELPNDIMYNSEVFDIECDKYVRLRCKNNVIFAHHVLITTSIGILRELTSKITPPLPENMCSIISNMGNFGIGKVFLIYEEKWWDFPGIQLIWSHNVVLSEEQKWMRHISGFDTVLNQPNILLGWVGGEGLLRMEELDEDEIGRDCASLFERFLQKPLPLPAKVIRRCWTKDPWIKGGYSYTSTDCDKLNLNIQDLSIPVSIKGEPKILLAGEAVHASHFSTTHGAYESGESQAQFLLDYLSLK